jgi:hypothetical protein
LTIIYFHIISNLESQSYLKIPKIDIEQDKPQKLPLPRWKGIKGRGIKKVTMHPHPLPTGRQAALSHQGRGETRSSQCLFLREMIGMEYWNGGIMGYNNR